jgi:putative colanic acid biosynthesis acetyltransferase WcaF
VSLASPEMKKHAQASQYSSPWTWREKLAMAAWGVCWTVACAWTPKPLNAWRLLWLRLFGARIEGTPFVHQRARIKIPWNITLRDRACLGDRANAYSLGPIEIGEAATVAQDAYLCAGTHDFDDPILPLCTAPIVIEARAFVCARAFILPGVRVGRNSIVGAGSVVTRDVPPDVVCAGNPARVIRSRNGNEGIVR